MDFKRSLFVLPYTSLSVKSNSIVIGCVCVLYSGGERSAEAGEHSGGSDSLENCWRSGLGPDLHCRAGESKTLNTLSLLQRDSSHSFTMVLLQKSLKKSCNIHYWLFLQFSLNNAWAQMSSLQMYVCVYAAKRHWSSDGSKMPHNEHWFIGNSREKNWEKIEISFSLCTWVPVRKNKKKYKTWWSAANTVLEAPSLEIQQKINSGHFNKEVNIISSTIWFHAADSRRSSLSTDQQGTVQFIPLLGSWRAAACHLKLLFL